MKDDAFFATKMADWTTVLDNSIQITKFARIKDGFRVLNDHYDSLDMERREFDAETCWLRCQDRNKCSAISFSLVKKKCLFYPGDVKLLITKDTDFQTISFENTEFQIEITSDLVQHVYSNWSQTIDEIAQTNIIKGIENKTLDIVTYINYAYQESAYSSQVDGLTQMILDFKSFKMDDQTKFFLENDFKNHLKIYQDNIAGIQVVPNEKVFENITTELETIAKGKSLTHFFLANLPRFKIMFDVANRLNNSLENNPYASWITRNLELEKFIQKLEERITSNPDNVNQTEASNVFTKFRNFEVFKLNSLK